MSQPTRFSGAAIPVPPANYAASVPDPATGNLMPGGLTGVPVEDTPQIDPNFAVLPMVPMLVTEDTGPYSKLASALADMGRDPGGNLGIVSPAGDRSWAAPEFMIAHQMQRPAGLLPDLGSGSHSPSSAPIVDTDHIYASIGEIPTVPAVVTLGSAFGDLPVDFAKLHLETPVGTP